MASFNSLPSYEATVKSRPRPSSSPTRKTLTTLPLAVLLRILSQIPAHDLHLRVRRVNRALYLPSMHLLRQHFLPFYAEKVRFPFTSDPMGERDPRGQSATIATAGEPVLPSIWRETRVLDLFIARTVIQLALTDESPLHIAALPNLSDGDAEDLLDISTRDLFDLQQPQARTEDLFVTRGESQGVVTRDSVPSGSGWDASRIRAQDVGIRFALRKVSLALPFAASTRGGTVPKAVAEVARARDDTLEVTVDRLIRAVGELINSGSLTRLDQPGKTSYAKSW